MPSLLPISMTLLAKSVMPAIGAAIRVVAASNASKRFLILGKLRSFSGF